MLSAWLSRTFELQSPQHARMLPMEGLRGVAVTLVFLHHYMVQAQLIGLSPGIAADVAGALRAYGNLGVELFFVLSGYLIYGTLVRRAPPFLEFMWRRIERIYPTFLVVFAVALALIFLLPVRGRIPDDPWRAALYLLANLALLPGLLPISRVVEVAWSLSYEMFFYATTAFLVIVGRMHTMSSRGRVAILAGLTSAFIGFSFLGLEHFPVRMMSFFAGMLLAEGMGKRVPAWLGIAAPAVSFLVSALGVLPGVLQQIIHSLAFFALCAVCFRGEGVVSRWMRWTPLRWLGNLSYSYYLLHGFVVRAAMVALAAVLPGGMADWLFWSIIPALFVATVLASSVLFVFVEKPFSLAPASHRPQRRRDAMANNQG